MLEKAEQLNSAVEEALAEDETLSANVAWVVPEGTKERFIPMQLLKEWDRSRLGYRFVKRAFDIVFSGCVIVVGFIPALVLCAIICAESPGNPIYVQTRVGKFIHKHFINEFPQFINVFLGDIPLRTLKTRPDFSKKIGGVFALPANEVWIVFIAFSQVSSCINVVLRALRNPICYFGAVCNGRRFFFADSIFEVVNA